MKMTLNEEPSEPVMFQTIGLFIKGKGCAFGEEWEGGAPIG